MEGEKRHRGCAYHASVMVRPFVVGLEEVGQLDLKLVELIEKDCSSRLDLVIVVCLNFVPAVSSSAVGECVYALQALRPW